ncbi:hypothetical protein DSO57_1010679 [Entomophthora muscae]|uniref:Uncharacterized protein n=2 Tax=Entomophthora muscae TaxID=34485 RepID=A0ACC2TUA4_9FUNG|nr:hypothetical protein DSO57_1010679 [Entomophthora muscae]
MDSNKEPISIYPKQHRAFPVDHQPYYSPFSQEYMSFSSSEKPQPYLYSPESKIDREKGVNGAQDFSPTSPRSSLKNLCNSQRVPVTQSNYQNFTNTWSTPSPKNRLSNSTVYPNSLDRDIGARHKKPGNFLPSGSDAHKRTRAHGHSKSVIKPNTILEARDDPSEPRGSPECLKSSVHKGGHQRSYSMLAEPFSRGYCGIPSEKSYSFPKKEASFYGHQIVNTTPVFTRHHRRFPSTQLSPSSQGTYDNSKKFGNPLSHSFSSRSESGKEVLYFEMPTTPPKAEVDGSFQTSFKIKVDSKGSTICEASSGSTDKPDYPVFHSAEKMNNNTAKKPTLTDSLAFPTADLVIDMSHKVSEINAGSYNKTDPPLQALVTKRRVNHKKHKTLGSPFDIALPKKPVSLEAPQFPSEILNLGDETMVELYDLLVNYQNPWGTRSVDEGQISKEIKDESLASNCADEDINSFATPLGSKSCASILQENFPKIARVQTWLSQNVSPETLAEETLTANHESAHKPSLDECLSEFDGDVLIGDFFYFSETKADQLNSDDDSHTHVETKESDSHSQHIITELPEGSLDQPLYCNNTNPPAQNHLPHAIAVNSDTNFDSPHTIILSSERTYERRLPTPEFDVEFEMEESSEVLPQVFYSPRLTTPEELSDLTTTISLALDASLSSPYQPNLLNVDQEPSTLSYGLEKSSLIHHLFETVQENVIDGSCSVKEETLNETLNQLDTSETPDSKSSLPDERKYAPVEIEGRFCFDTPVGPRKLVWLKGTQPLEAASSFCFKHGITNPLYSEALAWFLTNSCK